MTYNSNAAISGFTLSHDGGFTITYAEQRDITPNVLVARQISVNPGTVDPSGVVDAIRELLDLALIEMQDVPDEIARPHRMQDPGD